MVDLPPSLIHFLCEFNIFVVFLVSLENHDWSRLQGTIGIFVRWYVAQGTMRPVLIMISAATWILLLHAAMLCAAAINRLEKQLQLW
jgi:hypothetical protein